jgi:hypothetical protein
MIHESELNNAAQIPTIVSSTTSTLVHGEGGTLDMPVKPGNISKDD